MRSAAASSMAKNLISCGFKNESVKGIAYELSIDCVCDSNGEAALAELKPGETVYIKTNEEISLPDDITARIAERNSVMRLGLKVDGPQYIPGHKTFCFLRVQNISGNSITLAKDFVIAQMIFEKLDKAPDQIYPRQEGASFMDEKKFAGFGRYQGQYDKLMKKYDDVKDDIDSLKEKIYGNVLTIMGVFVSIFTLVSVNVQSFVKESISKSLIATVNLSLLTCIAVLLGLVLLIVNKGKKKWFSVFYLAIIVCLVIAVLAVSFIPA